MFPEKQPGEFRVLCLGNSVSAGNELSEVNTYPFLLRGYLQERCPGTLVRVQNGAVYGYSIVQGAMVLEEIADLYRPDLVIVGFAYFDLALVDKDDQPVTSHRWPMTVLRSLAFESRLYMTLRQTLLVQQARAHRGQPAEASLSVDPDRQERINTRYFRWFVEQARKRGFQLVLYQQYNHHERSHMVPLPPGFRPEVEAMYREMHPSPGQEPPPPHLLRAEQERLGLRIEELAWLEDVPTVDLSRTWRMISDIAKYMQDSSHPNVRGTRMQARDIANFLLDHGLVPGATR